MASAAKKTINTEKIESTQVVEDIKLNEEVIDVETQIASAKEEAVIAEPKAAAQVKTAKKKFASDEGIECVSITSGELGMIGIKSGINYRWADRLLFLSSVCFQENLSSTIICV